LLEYKSPKTCKRKITERNTKAGLEKKRLNLYPKEKPFSIASIIHDPRTKKVPKLIKKTPRDNPITICAKPIK